MKKINIKSILPIASIILVSIFVFRNFVFRGLLPIPSDIITGVYYPWLNQKWDTITGVPVKNPLPSDIPSLVYPWRLQVRNQIFSGKFPLWNDQIFSGMPLFANFQSSVLSISNLLFLFIKNHGLAWSLGVFFQPIFMCLSAFLFFREIKFSRLSSLFGSLLFTFNGYSTVWLEYNVHGWVLFWLPLMLLSTEFISRKIRWGNILLAVSVSGSILTGYPQLTLYSFLIVFIYSLIQLIYKYIDLKKVFSIGVFSVLGLLLSAVLLLPGIESAKLSIRNVDTVATSLETRFLPFSYLTNLIAPDIHGNPATYNYTGIGFYDNFAIYIGVVALLLSLIGLVSNKTPKHIRIFSGCLIIIGMTLSTQNQLGLLVSNISIFGIKSIAARAMILSVLGFILLAVSGIDSLNKKTTSTDLLLALVVVFGIASLCIFPNSLVYKRNLVLPLAVSVISLILLFVGRYCKKISIYVPLLMSIIMVFEVTRFANKYLSFTPYSYLFPTTPIINYLINNSDIQNSKYEFNKVIPENMWVPYGFRSAAGYDATAPLMYSKLLGMVNSNSLSNPHGRIGRIDNINKISDLIGVNYLFALSTKDGIPNSKGSIPEFISPPKFTQISTEGPVRVYQINGASKTISFFSNSLSYNSEADFINLVNSSNFIPLFQTTIKSGENLKSNEKATLTIDSYSSGKIIVTVNTKVEGYVVVKQNRYPGWSVTIDNKKADLLEADYAFMAVRVSPGAHTVAFRYLPQSFVTGTIISLLSFIALLGLVLRYVRK